MKTIKLFSFLTIFMALATLSLPMSSFAQKTTTEKIPVSGNCGMCKTKIEKAAKQAGATTATWNKDTKVLTIKYSSATTNAGKIQKSIAAAGYDTRDVKATDESYNKLHACCQYDREAVNEAKHQCSDNCDMKDGKCTDMASCKEKGCCKDEATCKANGCCAAKTGDNSKMDCCKDGKCSKPGHDGKDCCKKS